MNEAEQQEAIEVRIKAATEDAVHEFFLTVASKFPEIKTGDFPPDASIAFDRVCTDAVREWLLWNDFQRLQ